MIGNLPTQDAIFLLVVVTIAGLILVAQQIVINRER